MGEFRNKPLGVLDRIYGFLSGKTQSSQVTLETPVTVVHDVSREAELGSAFGFFNGLQGVNAVNTHVGAGTIRSAWDPYYYCLLGLDPTIQPTRDQVDIWLLDVSLLVDTPANLTRASVGYGYPANTFPPATGETLWPLLTGAGAGAIDFSNVAASGTSYLLSQQSHYFFEQHRPLFIAPGGVVTLYSLSTGALNVLGSLLFWVGRKGTTPPGAR